jgi:hypothetical protein
MNRMTLDGMRWSLSKVNAIFASMTEGESFLDYVFPLLRYHSRITDLSADDFKYAFGGQDDISHSGYLMQTDIVPMPEDSGKGMTNYDLLPESSMEYLEKMRTLCDERGVELILVKAPTNSWRYWWYDQWEAQVSEYANAHGLSYYNFIPLCDEMGIDWSQDTYDAGLHLNVYGAEKLSDYFGKILSEKHQIPDRRADEAQAARWQTRIDAYHEQRNKEN